MHNHIIEEKTLIIDQNILPSNKHSKSRLQGDNNLRKTKEELPKGDKKDPREALKFSSQTTSLPFKPTKQKPHFSFLSQPSTSLLK